ncbi:MAG TPA: M18 family aminopeptidase [Methylophilaceae bacterium]|nr:M18 family aminopeptidase [Methylophilaceae bacterium]
MTISPASRAQAQALLDFIDASPSPWHAVQTTEQQLLAQGYARLLETERWQLRAGGRYFVVRGGSSIIAFVLGQQMLADTGFRIVGAHTDSPGLRLKPKAAHASEGVVRLGVEVYGGPILATFADRDLSLAGRVHVRSGDGFETHLLRFDAPLVRLPNLAIHMNREVNEQGLKLHKQNELPLVVGMADGTDPQQGFLQQVANALQVDTADILTSEFNVYDTQKGAFWGAEQGFIADSQLDNLASCHAALTALLAQQNPLATSVMALFDHEEVGSESAAGAGGSFIADVLDRIAAHAGLDEEGRRCTQARSFFVSADMAHAWHPNFPAAYEPHHRVAVNAGPVIKSNANQRYSTGAESAARFIALCEKAGVPVQQYAHRTDLGCGSTIGPIVSARLGMSSIDVGSPMWAMHSLRESAGVLDHGYMISALTAVYAS